MKIMRYDLKLQNSYLIDLNVRLFLSTTLVNTCVLAPEHHTKEIF